MATLAADIIAEPLATLDPARPDRFADGSVHAIFDRLRKEAPVHYCPSSQFGPYWSICRHADIVEIESLPQLYSSEARHGGVSIIEANGDETSAFESFIMMDPPRHGPKRRAIAPAFTPSEMARLSESIRARTAAKLDALHIGQTFDWVSTVSIDLTIDMLAILFDFPWDERHKLRVWSDAITSLEMIANRPSQRAGHLLEMAQRFYQLWQERAGQAPGPDLLSMMIHSPALGQMDAQEFMGNMATLVVGGNDTTRNSMSGMIDAVSRWPEEWERLAADRTLVPNAASEIIRWQCPAAHMRRTALEDVLFRGHQIKAGDKLVLWYLSANRDEALFEDGARFRVDRPNARRHLSFGHGIHRCVGARLAELQLQILIEEMLDRNLRVEVAGPIEREAHPFLSIINHLPVRVRKG
jgi:cytochrome P450